MVKLRIALFSLACLLSLPLHAASGGAISRGGLGFLFPDNNSFLNPGQFALGHGVAPEVLYERTSKTNEEGITPSLVYGNGTFGIGAFGSRFGGSFSDNTGDTVGAGLGFAALKDRLTLGVGYSEYIGPGSSGLGNLDGTLTINPAPKGIAFGVDAGTTVGGPANVQHGTVGLGYAFTGGSKLELDLHANNLSYLKDFVASIDAVFGGQSVYFAPGYSWLNLAQQHQIAARLGFLLSKAVDFSVLAASLVVSNPDITYGVSLRAVF